jgi:hypothetical protein
MTDKTKEAIRRILWDYRITPEEYLRILDGEDCAPGFDRLWALRRAVEGMNYYDLIEIIGLDRIARDWDALKPSIRSRSRVRGIDYVLGKIPLSASR